MPFVAQGERVDVLGMSLSVAACGAPGTCSPRAPSASPPPSCWPPPPSCATLLLGLQRLRLPPLLVQIASFMIRYGDVITGRDAADADRPASRAASRRAACGTGACSPSRPARCSSAPTSAASGCTWRWSAAGYAGAMPVIDEVTASRAQWSYAAAPSRCAALVVCLLAMDL